MQSKLIALIVLTVLTSIYWTGCFDRYAPQTHQLKSNNRDRKTIDCAESSNTTASTRLFARLLQWCTKGSNWNIGIIQLIWYVASLRLWNSSVVYISKPLDAGRKNLLRVVHSYQSAKVSRGLPHHTLRDAVRTRRDCCARP